MIGLAANRASIRRLAPPALSPLSTRFNTGSIWAALPSCVTSETTSSCASTSIRLGCMGTTMQSAARAASLITFMKLPGVSTIRTSRGASRFRASPPSSCSAARSRSRGRWVRYLPARWSSGFRRRRDAERGTIATDAMPNGMAFRKPVSMSDIPNDFTICGCHRDKALLVAELPA